jgi:sulfonate dioxygenase
LTKDGDKKTDLSPNIGTEVEGVQLGQLDDAGKNDLALFLNT